MTSLSAYTFPLKTQPRLEETAPQTDELTAYRSLSVFVFNNTMKTEVAHYDCHAKIS